MSAEPQQVASQKAEVLRLQGLSLGDLHREIVQLSGAGVQNRRRFLELILALTGAGGAAVVEERGDNAYNVGPFLLDAKLKSALGSPEQTFADAGAQTIRSGEPHQNPLPADPTSALFTLPLASDRQALVLILPVSCENERAVMAQLLASNYDEARSTPAGSALISLADKDSLASVFSELAQSLKTSTGATIVFTGFCGRGDEAFALHSVAGVPDFDYRSDIAGEIAQVFSQAQESTERWSGSEENATAQLRSLATQLGAQNLTVISCKPGPVYEGIAVLIASDAALDNRNEEQLQFELKQLAQALYFRGKPFRSGLRRWLDPLRGKTFAIAGGLLALVIAIGFLPVTDHIKVDVLVEPAQQAMISTPFDAVLKAVNARAGDEIETGQLLLQLDGTELELEHEALLLEAKQLIQREASARAGGELDQALQIRLEIDKNAARAALVERRLGQLDILAPIRGTVLSADLDKEIGRALQTGQTLMELAPLTPLRAELQIPVREISRVPEQALVEITLDAIPDKHWEARIERIRPRAVSTQSTRYFVAEAVLENEAAEIRPGTRGEAVIEGRQTRLVQRLLWRPLAALREALHW